MNLERVAIHNLRQYEIHATASIGMKKNLLMEKFIKIHYLQ